MRPSAFAGLCLLLASPCHAGEFAFEDFPAPPASAATLRRIVPPTAEHSPFLDRALGRAPDFAGRYVLTINGCGTACQQVAAIDVGTGATHVPGDDGMTAQGACYRLDSRLLVLNPIAPDVEQRPAGFTTDFYAMTDDGFVHLGSSRTGTTLTCSDG